MTSITETNDQKNDVDAKDNSLGIPNAEFVDDVDEFMTREENENNATLVIKRFDERHNKYRFMEMNLVHKKRRLMKQIPDIKSSLDVLQVIKLKKESGKTLETNFMLSDQVYMKAQVPPTDKICLWLGANVMLEYYVEEAEQLLNKSISIATKNLDQIEKDLDFLRDQITTTEVNMARVYNWDVKRRQAEKQAKALA